MRSGANGNIHKNSYINTIITYIEQHLADEISPENVAKRHFISYAQLYRDFYNLTGHSVKEYIRKRRISNACERIKCSDIAFNVIASESGCQTQQSFNKQFKNIVGMTPKQYRDDNVYFYFYPFFNNEISCAVKVGAENIPECEIIRFYDSRLIDIEDKAIASLEQIKGRVFGRNGKQIGNQRCYEIMTERDKEKEQLNCSSSKTDLYATCVVNHNESEINNGWNYLYNIWLSSSMFEPSEVGYFEEYLFKKNKPYKLKLYLSVKKRKTAQHIKIMQMSEMTFITAKESGYNAEKKASEKVMDYMRNAFPNRLRNTQRFYVCEIGGEYVCGSEWGAPYGLGKYERRVAILHIPAGKYAVMSNVCFGDIRVGIEKIESWCINNNILHENEPAFTVYEIKNESYDTENIEMKLFKRLKDDTNG